jgi:transposase-like protein
MRMGVRWYLAYPLRYRHVEERMAACGVRLDHATIQRGVVQDSPLLEAALHRRTRPMLGCKAFEATQATLTGIERMHRLKKKQMVIEARDEGLTAAELFARWLRNFRTDRPYGLFTPS